MKAVVFYESGPDVAARAPAYMAEHRARWADDSDRLRVPLDDDLGSGFDPVQNRPHIFG